MFDTGLKIGQILKNADIVDTFKCGNMGGMRRSKTTIIHLSLFLIIQRVFTTTSGSEEFFIIPVWGRMVTRI